MKKIFSNFDWPLLIATLVISIFGSVMVASVASSFLTQHLTHLFLALIFFFIFSQLDYRVYIKISPLLFGLSLIFLLLPLVFGEITRGTLRWVQIGSLTIQPSELVKPFLILFFSYFFCSPKVKGKKMVIGFLFLLIPVFLIFSQPDFGSTLVMIFSWVGIVLAAGITWHFLLLGGILFLFLPPLVWRFLKNYQRLRILSFFNPLKDPLGTSYNLIQAKITVGSGQFFGRGLGKGTQSHLKFLPERHTDFIFASLAEELGFLGAVFLILAFGFLLWRILAISQKSKDNFGFLFCVGCFGLLFSQIFINIAINLGLLPVTGIPLPLVSYGGSSVLATMICLGIVQNIAKQKGREKIIEIR